MLESRNFVIFLKFIWQHLYKNFWKILHQWDPQGSKVRKWYFHKIERCGYITYDLSRKSISFTVFKKAFKKLWLSYIILYKAVIYQEMTSSFGQSKGHTCEIVLQIMTSSTYIWRRIIYFDNEMFVKWIDYICCPFLHTVTKPAKTLVVIGLKKL